MMLVSDDSSVNISEDKHINFYTIVPIYEEEMQYKLDHDADELIELFQNKGISYPLVVNKQRKNVCVDKD